MLAAQNGHANAIEKLLELGGASTDAALIHAAQNGQSNTVELLLNLGANTEQANGNGEKILMLAAQNGHAETVELLLKAGAIVNDLNNDNKYRHVASSALIEAAANGHEATVTLLLRAKANVNGLNGDDRTALTAAATFGQLGMAKLLLGAGAWISPEDPPYDPDEPFASAAFIAARAEYRSHFFDEYDNWESSALIEAVSNGHAEIVKLFLGAGASVNHFVGSSGDTALGAAAWRNDVEILDLIIEAKADFTQSISFAINDDDLKIIKTLIGIGADLNEIRDHEDTTLLEEAVQCQRTEMFKILITRGAKILFELEANTDPKIKELMKVGEIADKIDSNTLNDEDREYIASDSCNGDVIIKRLIALNDHDSMGLFKEIVKGTRLEASAEQFLEMQHSILNIAGVSLIHTKFYGLGMYDKEFILERLEYFNKELSTDIKLEDEDFFDKLKTHKEFIGEYMYGAFTGEKFVTLRKCYLQDNYLEVFLKEILDSPNHFLDSLLAMERTLYRGPEGSSTPVIVSLVPSAVILRILENSDFTLNQQARATLKSLSTFLREVTKDKSKQIIEEDSLKRLEAREVQVLKDDNGNFYPIDGKFRSDAWKEVTVYQSLETKQFLNMDNYHAVAVDKDIFSVERKNEATLEEELSDIDDADVSTALIETTESDNLKIIKEILAIHVLKKARIEATSSSKTNSEESVQVIEVEAYMTLTGELRPMGGSSASNWEVVNAYQSVKTGELLSTKPNNAIETTKGDDHSFVKRKADVLSEDESSEIDHSDEAHTSKQARTDISSAELDKTPIGDIGHTPTCSLLSGVMNVMGNIAGGAQVHKLVSDGGSNNLYGLFFEDVKGYAIKALEFKATPSSSDKGESGLPPVNYFLAGSLSAHFTVMPLKNYIYDAMDGKVGNHSIVEYYQAPFAASNLLSLTLSHAMAWSVNSLTELSSINKLFTIKITNDLLHSFVKDASSQTTILDYVQSMAGYVAKNIIASTITTHATHEMAVDNGFGAGFVSSVMVGLVGDALQLSFNTMMEESVYGDFFPRDEL